MYKVNDSLVEKMQKKQRGNRTFGLFMGVIFLIMATIFVFTNFILISVYVDGESMEPTLKSSEVLFANKNIAPEEGDIIVIDGEKESENGSGYDWLIKRAIVIGQKDKTIFVKIENGKVLVGEDLNDLQELKETYLPENTSTPDGIFPYWEINEGEIFYLGDNRKNSKDSRSEYGTCSVKQVVGVVPEWALSMRGLSRFLYDAGKYFSNLF